MQQTFFVSNNRYKVSVKYVMGGFHDWMKNTGRKMIPMICYSTDSTLKHDLCSEGVTLVNF